MPIEDYVKNFDKSSSKLNSIEPISIANMTFFLMVIGNNYQYF